MARIRNVNKKTNGLEVSLPIKKPLDVRTLGFVAGTDVDFSQDGQDLRVKLRPKQNVPVAADTHVVEEKKEGDSE